MEQKLSAMKYIKNNKRRVSVLIVSLSLCCVLIYLLNFLLSTTKESYEELLVEKPEKIQYIELPGYAYGMEPETENYLEVYYQNELRLAGEIEQQEGVYEVMISQIIFAEILAIVGQCPYEIPCVEAQNIPVLLEHMGATLKEGRLPSQPGEIVLDESTMANGDYRIGDKLYTDDFTIVGVIDCDTYFGCGVEVENESYGKVICVLTDGSITDWSEQLHKMGYKFDEEDADIADVKNGETDLKKNIIDSINKPVNTVYAGVLIILSISLLVVYTMYLRDRRNEWCLYCSIGYSRKNIYYSIMRELLFTFIAALAIGSVLLIISMIALDYAMIRPLGLRCSYFMPKVLGEMAASYVLLFGILQIPVRYALYKIRTIDAIEDDLY